MCTWCMCAQGPQPVLPSARVAPWPLETRLGLAVHGPEDGFFAVSEGRPDVKTVMYWVLPAQAVRDMQYPEGDARRTGGSIHAPEAVRGQRVPRFIDNAVALAALVHGYVSKADNTWPRWTTHIT